MIFPQHKCDHPGINLTVTIISLIQTDTVFQQMKKKSPYINQTYSDPDSYAEGEATFWLSPSAQGISEQKSSERSRSPWRLHALNATENKVTKAAPLKMSTVKSFEMQRLSTSQNWALFQQLPPKRVSPQPSPHCSLQCHRALPISLFSSFSDA